jgi:hypothetical protein
VALEIGPATNPCSLTLFPIIWTMTRRRAFGWPVRRGDARKPRVGAAAPATEDSNSPPDTAANTASHDLELHQLESIRR